jgi:hypothetical protein
LTLVLAIWWESFLGVGDVEGNSTQGSTAAYGGLSIGLKRACVSLPRTNPTGALANHRPLHYEEEEEEVTEVGVKSEATMTWIF